MDNDHAKFNDILATIWTMLYSKLIIVSEWSMPTHPQQYIQEIVMDFL